MVSFTIYYLLMHFYLHVALKSQRFERHSILMAFLEKGRIKVLTKYALPMEILTIFELK